MLLGPYQARKGAPAGEVILREEEHPAHLRAMGEELILRAAGAHDEFAEKRVVLRAVRLGQVRVRHFVTEPVEGTLPEDLEGAGNGSDRPGGGERCGAQALGS